MKTNKFEPSFESLSQFECPDWFRDAKFGIWNHWGPQSVPMCGDWYARNMYIQDSPQYLYHIRHYGHPSKFGYKDICGLWKAEKFDPDALMQLFVKAGAKYFVSQAMHHDNFFNFNSSVNRFNSVNIGPKQDICGLMKKAADKYSLPFGLSEHLGASFSWWKTNKACDNHGQYKGVPYDGTDTEYEDFYYDNQAHLDNNPNLNSFDPWYTKDKRFHQYWLNAMKEMIDLYQPDLLYTDGGLPFGDYGKDDNSYKYGLEAVAHLYNTSINKHGENRAIYTNKDRRPEVYGIGILDVEKSQLNDIILSPWQTDTCIGNWFYDAKQIYKKPGHIIEMLIDIAAKNGSMLLNILQRPDGSLDDQTVYILNELAKWMSVCKEAIYGTRPWRCYGEGESKVTSTYVFEEKQVAWNSNDLRFTSKDNKLYAFMMAVSQDRVAVIKSLNPSERVVSVKLLGGGECNFSQNFGVLTVKLPQELPTIYTNCLKIELYKG